MTRPRHRRSKSPKLLSMIILPGTVIAISYPLFAQKPTPIPPIAGSESLALDDETATAPGNDSKPNSQELPPAKPIEGVVYYCSDGDTCQIQAAEALWMNVRLAGVDAPETPKGRGKKKRGGQPLGEAAQQFLNERLKNRRVRIKQVDLDPYNRPVVELTATNETRPINLMLIEQGLAEMYRGKTKRIDRAIYAATEAKAKEQKRGIWGLANYQSPSEYRRSMKK